MFDAIYMADLSANNLKGLAHPYEVKSTRNRLIFKNKSKFPLFGGEVGIFIFA